MRLWHQALIPKLPSRQLLGQHRECCAMRGKGWGKRHSTVDYAFTHEPALLVAYHLLIIKEMQNRGYKPSSIWKNPEYRGRALGFCENWCSPSEVNPYLRTALLRNDIIFPEHDGSYLAECIENLNRKGIVV